MFHRLNAAKQVIEASDRVKTRITAKVTRELRNPLNAILGYTQPQKKGPGQMARYGHCRAPAAVHRHPRPNHGGAPGIRSEALVRARLEPIVKGP